MLAATQQESAAQIAARIELALNARGYAAARGDGNAAAVVAVDMVRSSTYHRHQHESMSNLHTTLGALPLVQRHRTRIAVNMAHVGIAGIAFVTVQEVQ